LRARTSPVNTPRANKDMGTTALDTFACLSLYPEGIWQ
jgi:hypothetical protein